MVNDAQDIYSLSNADLIAGIGRRYRTYRLAARKTQKEISFLSGVSIFTIRNFENGRNSNISMKNLMALMRAIGCLEEVEKFLPELPLSPELLAIMNREQKKRVYHGK